MIPALSTWPLRGRIAVVAFLLSALFALPLALPAEGQMGMQRGEDPMDDLGSLEPEDGKWLTDDEGEEYFVKKLPKKEGTYQYYGENQVRYKHWFIFDLVKEDDENLYIKIYKPREHRPGFTREEVEARRAKEEAAVAASYQVEVGESDRLTYIPFDQGLPRRGMWRNGFDIADVNGDGHLDIVHGPARKGAPVPRIFLGDGEGNWKLWREARYPRAPYDYGDAAAADFDGDGLTDLAFGFHLRGLLALRQSSPGVFEVWSEGLDLQVPGAGSDASGFSTRAIELADWNGDGRIDILAAGEGPRPAGQKGDKTTGMVSSQAFGVAVYLNHGDGTWERLGADKKTSGLFGDYLAYGDVNADGRLDLVTSSNLLGRQNILHLGSEDGEWERYTVDQIRPNAYLQSVGIADFDGDGRDDIAIGYASWQLKFWRTGLDVLFSRPDDTWERRTLFLEESRLSLWALGTGDVDGDENADIVVSTGDGGVMVFLGTGKGTFTREAATSLHSARGCRGYAVRLADLNGDGKDEIVAAFADEGSALPMTEFPVTCTSAGAIMAWRTESSQAEKAAADSAQTEASQKDLGASEGLDMSTEEGL